MVDPLPGERVRFKKENNFGMDHNLIFTIKEVYRRPRYTAKWCVINELADPYNRVKASNLDPAEPWRRRWTQN